MEKIKLGSRVKCMVTGFVGIATARVEYLNGCNQLCVKPPIKESDPNKMPEGQYIDEQQLVYVDEGVNVVQKQTGGPQMDTPKG